MIYAMLLSVYYFDPNGEKNHYRKVEKNYSWNQNNLINHRINEGEKKEKKKGKERGRWIYCWRTKI